MKDFSLLRRLLVTDGRGDAGRIEQVVRQALSGGIRAFQIREREMPDRRLLSLLRRLRAMLPRGKSLLLVNDRIDLCLAADADGVQLGFRSVPVVSARELLGRHRWIGASIHRSEEARSGASAGADFLLFGPVFATPSKQGILPPAGIRALEKTVRLSPIPVIAIGGIGTGNAARTLGSGCHGLACIREIFEASRRRLRAQAFAEARVP